MSSFSKLLGIIPLSSASKSQRTRLVELVDHMLTLHRQLAKTRTGHEQTALRRQVETTDAQIDSLVYDLYGLTNEETRIVDDATG